MSHLVLFSSVQAEWYICVDACVNWSTIVRQTWAKDVTQQLVTKVHQEVAMNADGNEKDFPEQLSGFQHWILFTLQGGGHRTESMDSLALRLHWLAHVITATKMRHCAIFNDIRLSMPEKDPICLLAQLLQSQMSNCCAIYFHIRERPERSMFDLCVRVRPESNLSISNFSCFSFLFFFLYILKRGNLYP